MPSSAGSYRWTGSNISSSICTCPLTKTTGHPCRLGLKATAQCPLVRGRRYETTMALVDLHDTSPGKHQRMSTSIDDQLSLDDLGVLVGTDKNSLIGDYLRHYDEIFGHLRHVEFNLIEIGVFHGASLRLWQRYFTRARIIGIDD